MKSKILNCIIFSIITLIITACGNKTESKSENSKEHERNVIVNNKKENLSTLNSSNTNQTIEVIIENNADFIVVGKPTKVYLKKKNIYKMMNEVSVYSAEIDLGKDLEMKANSAMFLLTATEENLKDGNIKIELTERIENKEDIIHDFLIPVKNN